MTETQRRQYIADEINAKIATNTTVEQLAFLAEAFTQLEKTGLTLVYGTEELAIKLNNAIIAAAQAPTATGRDIRLAEKYSKNLLNTPPVDGDYAAGFPSQLFYGSPTAHTFSGATDVDGTVTHYLVTDISDPNLTVTTAEVAAGSAHTFTVANIAGDITGVTFTVKAKDAEGAYSAGVTITVDLMKKMIPVYGLIHNVTDDTYKRFGTGTTEDTVWLSPTAARLNDVHTNNDPVTLFFDRPTTVQGNMKRVIQNDDGSVAGLYSGAAITATQQATVQIPKCHYINVDIVANSKTYRVVAFSLQAFTLFPADLGLSSITSIVGHKVTGFNSYGAISGVTSVTSVVHPAFIQDGKTETSPEAELLPYRYPGAFFGVNVSGKLRSIAHTAGTTTPVTVTGSLSLDTATAYARAVGAGWDNSEFMLRDLIVNLAWVERGSWKLEEKTSTTVGNANPAGGEGQTKWDGNTNTFYSGQSAYDRVNGLTIPLGDKTGVIKATVGTEQRVVANSYRGIENYYGAVWQWCEGVFFSGNIRLFKPKKTGTVTRDTTYFNIDTGIVKWFTTASWLGYIGKMVPGTTILANDVSGTATTKLTDQVYGGSGNSLFVGGDLSYPAYSGLSCWFGSYSSLAAAWALVSRPSF
jgi:hypothetical protein